MPDAVKLDDSLVPDPLPATDFDQLLTRADGSRADRLRQNLAAAGAMTPEAHAEALNLAAKTGLAPDLIGRNRDAVKQQVESDLDFDGLVKRHPALARWLESPDNAAIAHRELDQLGTVERQVRDLGGDTFLNQMGRAGTTGLHHVSAALAHDAVLTGLVQPDVGAQLVAEANRNAQTLRAQQPAYMAEFNQTMAGESQDVDTAVQRWLTDSANARDQGDIFKGLALAAENAGGTALQALDFIWQAFSRPRGLAYTTTENLANALPSLGGAAVGAGIGTAAGPIGTTAGFVGGTFVGSAVVEVGSWVDQGLAKRGFDTTNPDDLLRAYADPVLMAELRGEAQRKGLTTAGVDALFSLFAGTFVHRAAGSATSTVGRVAQKGAAAATDVGVQAIGEGASELAGQIAAAKGDLSQVSAGESLLEAVTSIGQGAAQTTAGAIRMRAVQLTATARKAFEAHQDATAVEQAVAAAKLAPTTLTVPGRLASLVQSASPERAVYFQTDAWDEYWHGQDVAPSEAAAKILGDEGRAYFTAKSLGSEITIPLGAYVEQLATNEQAAGLLEHAQYRGDGLTVADARAFLTDLPEQLKSLAQEATAVEPEATNAPADQVHEHVAAQLKEDPRFAKQADAYATLVSQAFTSLESRGVNPEALVRLFDLRVASPSVEIDQHLDLLRTGKGPTDRDIHGESLVDFLRGIGLRDDGTELSTMGVDNQLKPFQRKLVRKDGIGLDAAAERALEAGYISERDIPELLGAIDDELRGKPHFRLGEEDPVKASLRDSLESMRRDLQTAAIDLATTDNATARAALAPERAQRRTELLQVDAAQGDTVRQPGDQTPRGSFGYTPSGQALITLLDNANLSTFLHESGHFFLDVMTTLAGLADAPEAIQDDVQRVMDWFGVKDLAAWQAMSFEERRRFHEQWAVGFEQYLAEGKAPSAALRRAFARFRAWLMAVYRDLRGRVQLTPEVRGVMDRLLASSDEINVALARQNAKPVIDDVEIHQAAEDARIEAEEELTREVMADVRKEQDAQWQEERATIRAAVEREINGRREYVAREILVSGRMPDGTPLPSETPIKLDSQSLARFPKELTKRIPVNARRKTGGISVDAAAEIFGFSSGDELIRSIADLPKRVDAIEQETDRRMQAAHPDLARDGAMAEAAMKAIHGEKRAKLLLLELRKLGTRIGRTPSPIELIREQAKRAVEDRRVRELSPDAYRRAEARAARLAFEAAAKGNEPAAFVQKLRELQNHELYRAAVAAKERSQKALDYAKRLANDSTRARIGMAGSDYLEQIDRLLERYEFKPVSLKALERRESLRQFVDKQLAAGLPHAVPDAIIDDARQVNYRELTVGELDAVHDALIAIEHLASIKNKLLASAKHRDFALAVDEAVASIEQSLPKLSASKIAAERDGRDRALEWLDGVVAAHRKVSSYARQMDGDAHGVAWELLARPLNLAADLEVERRQQEAQAQRGLWDTWAKAGANLVDKVHINAIGTSLSLESRLMVALNWGNEGNRERLMQGETWGAPQVEAILATLTEADWTLVQGILDHIETFWPEIAAKEKRVTGLEPDKVQAAPIRTPFGVLRGGYFPVVYDARRSPKAQTNEAATAAKLYALGQATKATTRRGHTKERTGSLGKPLRLDLDVVSQHLSQVVHDLTHHETIIDLNRLLNDDRLASTIHEHLGLAALRAMKNTVQDVAVADLSDNDVDRTLRSLRNGVSIAVIGANLSTTLLQLTGFFQSARRVGTKSLLRAVGALYGRLGGTEASFERIREKSSFMRSRASTMLRETNEVLNQIRGDDLQQKITFWSYYLIQRAQLLVDYPTWLAGYERARTEGLDEDTAIAQADQAVIDAQGSGATKDLAGVQRTKGVAQLFTPFYSYASAMFNQTAEAVSAARAKDYSPEALVTLASDLALLYLLPAVATAALRTAISDDDEERAFAGTVGKELIASAMGTMIGVRELSGALTEGYRYKGPAGTMFFGAVSDIIVQAKQGELDGALVRASAKAVGIALHLPTGQAVKTIEGLMEHPGDPRAWLFGSKKR